VGEDCLEELRGMFALALLDLRKRYATAPLLFLARDPLGIKAFVLHADQRDCVASEKFAALWPENGGEGAFRKTR